MQNISSQGKYKYAGITDVDGMLSIDSTIAYVAEQRDKKMPDVYKRTPMFRNDTLITDIQSMKINNAIM